MSNNLFIVARIKADERVAGNANVILVPQEPLMTVGGARNVAANGYRNALAVRAAARVRL